MLFEAFLVREARAGRLRLDLQAVHKPLLVHGHCHQKAFDALAPTLEALRLIPGAEPQLIDSSCCGMAGSFGYEATHHEVSRRMAEANLLPAIRSQPQALVVADGTSCRHQIRDLGGRQAKHVARVLAECLARRTDRP
jgi:Fe-S oxidoreductase